MKQTHLQFIRKAFNGLRDKSQRLSWVHAHDTALRLEAFAKNANELTIQQRLILGDAALAHDLLEDTNITKSKLRLIFGKEVVNIVELLTNKQGDSDFSLYIKTLMTAPEEVLLVKYADIASNTRHSIIARRILGKKWINSFWLPLLQQYSKTLLKKKFVQYPKTAKLFQVAILDDITEIKKKVSKM